MEMQTRHKDNSSIPSTKPVMEGRGRAIQYKTSLKKITSSFVLHPHVMLNTSKNKQQVHKTESVNLHGWKKWDENHSHPTLFSHPISTWLKTQGSHMCSKPPTLFIPAQIKPNYCSSDRTFFFFTWGRSTLCLHACYNAMLLPQSH